MFRARSAGPAFASRDRDARPLRGSSRRRSVVRSDLTDSFVPSFREPLAMTLARRPLGSPTRKEVPMVLKCPAELLGSPADGVIPGWRA